MPQPYVLTSHNFVSPNYGGLLTEPFGRLASLAEQNTISIILSLEIQNPQ